MRHNIAEFVVITAATAVIVVIGFVMLVRTAGLATVTVVPKFN